jgi:hypothetical protein
MTELRNHDGEIGLARQFPVSVLITAPADRALAIANAIADENETECEDLLVREVNGLSEAEQVALMQLLDTETDQGRRRIIATTSTSLFDRVQNGAFLEDLFYRLNVIHIVGDSLSEGCGTSSRPIIAA